MSIVFEEQRFPLDISWGSQGGPRWSTTINAATSGFEQRNINWSDVRHAWDLRYGIKHREHMLRVVAFFNAVRGKATGFRFFPPLDFRADEEPFGTAVPPDGILTAFQLERTYTLGSRTYIRNITKPAGVQSPGALIPSPDGQGPLRIFLNAVEQTTPVQYTLDETTGIVTFVVAPILNDVLTWTGPFDVPVRFDVDMLNASELIEDLFDWPEIRVVEVREIA